MNKCKKIVSLATAAVMAMSTVGAATTMNVEAASDIKTFNGHYYQYVGTITEAGIAELNADLKGGHLVTITSEEENKFIAENVIPEGTEEINIWLGAKKTSKGSWSWVTGEKFSYTNWMSGQPSAGNGETYMQMTNGAWDDCTITLNWHSEGCASVIEWDSEKEYQAYKNKKTATMRKNIEGTKLFNGHSYKYYEIATTWKNASKYCKKLGGYLATITSSKENDVVYKLTGGSNAWFGLNDAKKEGKYKWVTKERTDFLKLSKDVNNDYSGAEDYFGFFEGKKWNDYRNDDTAVKGFICEWDTKNNTILTAVKNKVSVKEGKTYALPYQIYPIKKKVTFSSSKPSVATVSKKGVVTAKKKGTAKITIKSGKKKVVVTVKVK